MHTLMVTSTNPQVVYASSFRFTKILACDLSLVKDSKPSVTILSNEIISVITGATS